MKKSKKNFKNIIVIILVIVVFVIFLIVFKSKNTFFDDNLIFFKLFDSSLFSRITTKDENLIANKQADIENSNEVFFYVDYDNIDFKKINLNETIDKDTLIKEKIAPGTKGNFKIFLLSNTDINYNINFKSQNSKPKNLIFQIDGQSKQYKTLEELQEDLVGNINKNEVKEISINWYWKYNNNEKEDLQDTKDGQQIQNYNFDITVIVY